MYGPQMMWGNGWSGMLLGPLMMVLLLALLIAAFVVLSRSLTRRPKLPAHATPTPLDILHERFARGEIDKEEYGERRWVLRD